MSARRRAPMILAAAGVAALAASSTAVAADTLPFDRARAVEGRPAVRVIVQAPNPCHLPPRHAVVRETRRTVRIRLVASEPPPDTVCVQVVAYACVEVPLRRRLGTRRVVDRSGREAEVDTRSARRARREGCRRVPRRD